MKINYNVVITTFDKKGNISHHVRFGADTKERSQSIIDDHVSRDMKMWKFSEYKRIYSDEWEKYINSDSRYEHY